MCQLMGLAFNMKVDAKFSFRGFRHRGKDNPDGWGIAYYSGNEAQVFKEQISAEESPIAINIVTSSNFESKIFIAHVRLTSRGSINYDNTHPFKRRLFKKDFVFAHNGTLYNYKNLSLKEFKPIGETDSEHAFCYILEKIKKLKITTWNKSNFDLLNQILKYEINKFGTFNCLMSDGDYLFCYFDKNGYNGLFYVERKSPFDKVKLMDEDFEINLAEEKHPDQKGFIVATSPLTNEKWEEFSPGNLYVFRNGEMVYPSDKKLNHLTK